VTPPTTHLVTLLRKAQEVIRCEATSNDADLLIAEIERALLPQHGASLDDLIALGDNFILPIDVKIGAGTFRKGVKVGTMLRCLKNHAQYAIADAYHCTCPGGTPTGPLGRHNQCKLHGVDAKPLPPFGPWRCKCGAFNLIAGQPCGSCERPAPSAVEHRAEPQK
jgi:hypothetical protein